MLRAAIAAIFSLTALPAAAEPDLVVHVQSEVPVRRVDFTGEQAGGEPERLTPELLRTTEQRSRAEALGLVLEDGLVGESRQPIYEPTALGARAVITRGPLELGVYARDELTELDASSVRTSTPGVYFFTGHRLPFAGSLEIAAGAELPSVALDGRAAARQSLARQERIKSELELVSGLTLIAGFGEAQSLPAPELLAESPDAPLDEARTLEVGARLTLPESELLLSGFQTWTEETRRAGARVGVGLEPADWIATAASATLSPGVRDAPELVLGSGVELGGPLARGISAGGGLGARWLGVALFDVTASAQIGLVTLDLELANLLDTGAAPAEASVAADTSYTLTHPLAARGFVVATPRTLMLELGVEI